MSEKELLILVIVIIESWCFYKYSIKEIIQNKIYIFGSLCLILFLLMESL